MTQGWTDVDRKAAAAAGVTGADLEKLKAARLALDYRTLAVRPAEALRHARARAHFASLPASVRRGTCPECGHGLDNTVGLPLVCSREARHRGQYQLE
jgi:hypothetical protein